MWPEFKTFKLDFRGEGSREEFSKATNLVDKLVTDIGFLDKVLVFDSEENLEKALIILSENNIHTALRRES